MEITIPVKASMLSDRVRAFLRDNHLSVLSTINKDGTPHLTTVVYALDDDGAIALNVDRNGQKAKNLRRDPRAAMCVRDGNRYISMYGTIEFLDDATTNRRDLERFGLLDLFLARTEEAKRAEAAKRIEQQRVSVRFAIRKVIDRLG